MPDNAELRQPGPLDAVALKSAHRVFEVSDHVDMPTRVRRAIEAYEQHLAAKAWVSEFLDPPVDYDFDNEFSVTLPAHQWQLLLRASRHGVNHVTGIAQAYQEIGRAYRVARTTRRVRSNAR